MIATLTGVVADKGSSSIVLDIAGVGYGVALAKSDLESLTTGHEVHLYIHEVIREDAHDLYGFLEMLGRELFNQLLGVSGVGPKAALAILSITSISDVQNAIGTGDVAFLQSASGVGKRTAERIAIELKDKVVIGEFEASLDSNFSDDAALQGLEALGYSRSVAANALAKIPRDLDDGERIKQALKEL